MDSEWKEIEWRPRKNYLKRIGLKESKKVRIWTFHIGNNIISRIIKYRGDNFYWYENNITHKSGHKNNLLDAKRYAI